MSTLGKILTVMVALVAIAVAVLVARVFVMEKNWKDAYDKQVVISGTLEGQRADMEKQRDAEKKAHDEERVALEGQIAARQTVITERDGTIARLTQEQIGQAKRLQDLVVATEGLKKSYEVLIGERKQWLDERDKAIATAAEFTRMYSELEVKYRTDQYNLASLKGDLTNAMASIADYQGKIQFILQTYPQVRVPSKGPYPPVVAMKGMVTSVDMAAKIAEINLGSDSGVTPGTVFIVYGEPGTQFLAELTIKKVGPKTAAGDLSVIRGTVKVSDHVQNKPE